MKQLSILLLLFLAFTVEMNATVYVSVSDGAWNNSSNWSPSVPPTTLGVNDTLIIGHHIAFNSNLTIKGLLCVNANSSLKGNKAIDIDYDGLIENKGTIVINDDLHIDGSMENSRYLRADNSHIDGYLCNSDSFVVLGKIDFHGSTVECAGDIVNCDMKFHDNSWPLDIKNQNLCCSNGSTIPVIDSSSGNVDWSTVGKCGSVLPVGFSFLKLVQEENTLVVNWGTNNEQNTERFGVERSSDGIQFKSIGTQGASGYSNQLKEYQFRDIEPEQGANYYRIKVIDLDGKYSYSNVLFTLFGKSSSIKVYPNPVSKGILNITFDGIDGNANKLCIADITGKEMLSLTIESKIKAFSLQVADYHLEPGVYLLSITGNESRFNKKIIIQ